MIKEEEIKALFRQHQGGRFEVEGILGAGAMGIVVRAFDTRLKVFRAIKIFNPELLANESLVQRFENEASIMAGIDHPNIVKVYDVGEIEHHHFMVLEWIDGGSLKTILEDTGAMHSRIALEMIYKVCDALTVAHKRGVIHRDIKPDNILITKEGIPKVADFGIAHVDGDQENPLTGIGEGLATPRIGAPEQWADAASVDARSDVYATAVTFWILMKAMHPPGLLFLQDLEQNPELLKGIPTCLHSIIKKAVAYSPSGRYATMEEFAQALRLAEDHLPPFDGEVVLSVVVDGSVSVTDQTYVSDPVSINRETVAYGAKGFIKRNENVPVGEAREPPPRTVPIRSAPKRRTSLITISVLCLAGLGGFALVFFQTPNTPIKQAVNVETIPNIIESDVVSETADVSIINADVPVASDVSQTELIVALDKEVASTSVQISAEDSVEKRLEKKDHKGTKLVHSVELKAGETLVLKPVIDHPRPPPIIESPQPKPEAVVKVQVGLELSSDDTARVWLVGTDGKHKLPGSVAPGTYRVIAAFKDQEGEVTTISHLEVKEGENIKLSCNSAFVKCRKL